MSYKRYKQWMIIDQYTKKRSSTLQEWWQSDSLETFNSNKTNNRELLEKYNWIDQDGNTVKIDYVTNRFGLRVESMEKRVPVEKGILYVGDSNVFGVGMHYHDNYTYIAHNNSIYKNLPYVNFGIPGKGIDAYYRVLSYVIDEYKPYGVVVAWPWHETRREYYHPKHKEWKTSFFRDEDEPMKYFSHEENDLRLQKNLDAMENLVTKRGSKFYYLPDTKELLRGNWQENGARDLIHYGVLQHQLLAGNMVNILDNILWSEK
jgi:hypothetical protein